MADVETELQVAIVAVLQGDAFQAALGQQVPVYDRVPGSMKPPYFKVGDDQVLPDLASGYDGSRTHVTIGVWAPGPGKVLAKKMGGLARHVLAPQQPTVRPPFVLTSHHLVTWSFESAQYLDDVDGVSAKGVIVISYDTYPTA